MAVALHHVAKTPASYGGRTLQESSLMPRFSQQCADSAPSPKNRPRGRLDGVLNYEMAIRDSKYAGNRFGVRLPGSFRKGTFDETKVAGFEPAVESDTKDLTVSGCEYAQPPCAAVALQSSDTKYLPLSPLDTDLQCVICGCADIQNGLRSEILVLVSECQTK